MNQIVLTGWARVKEKGCELVFIDANAQSFSWEEKGERLGNVDNKAISNVAVTKQPLSPKNLSQNLRKETDGKLWMRQKITEIWKYFVAHQFATLIGIIFA